MIGLVGLFDFFAGTWEGRNARAARAKERAGDLVAAGELFVEAGLLDEAARVLLLRADAERALDKRIALCAAASRTATDPGVRRHALARKALLAFEVLRDGPAHPRGELQRVARELEEAGELGQAAEAYALAGDSEAEIRVLTAAGAIEQLEARLAGAARVDRQVRDRDALLRRVRDLDRVAERRAALELAARWLTAHDDEEVRRLAQSIRQRLLRGPLIDLELDGSAGRWALGDEITLGRGEASIPVRSRAVSRQHLRVFVGSDGPMVEDLSTHNGTLLAGARVSAPIPIGRGLLLSLGGEVPCAITPVGEGSSVAIDVAGEQILAPLGDLRVGHWRLRPSTFDGMPLVELCTTDGGSRPLLGELELAACVELSIGDALRRSRAERPSLRVLAQRGP
jgi:hypothetical protein